MSEPGSMEFTVPMTDLVIETHDVTPVLGLPIYDIALVMIGVSMLMAMIRLLRGPTLADRVVALDLLAFFAAGAISIIAVGTNRPELMMVAIVVALLTFMGTAAFALYLERQGREAETGRPRDAF
ncbi:MAG: cation:proton antiporter [Phycisphaerales bacterium]|nr:cation:proton antiporter [Planctomycetota bacterium]MCH8508011.1 cation:proton antiporter [Phycisphaerales bacterium]